MQRLSGALLTLAALPSPLLSPKAQTFDYRRNRAQIRSADRGQSHGLALTGDEYRSYAARTGTSHKGVLMRPSLAFILAASLPQSALAATYWVNNTSEPPGPSCTVTGAYNGSLRWAIQQANTNFGHDKIRFKTGLSGTITLNCQLEITDAVDWISTSAIKVDAASFNLSGSPNAYAIELDGSSTDSYLFDGLDLKGGTSRGGIRKLAGSGLTVQNSLIRDFGSAALGGIAILVPSAYPGDLTIINTVIQDNESSVGAAVDYQGASGDTLLIKQSSFLRNDNTSGFGGALRVGGTATMTIETSTFFENSANKHGGAIYIDGSDGGDVDVTNSTFDANEVTGLSICSGTCQGGAIFMQGDEITPYVLSDLNLTNCTIADNQAQSGHAVGKTAHVRAYIYNTILAKEDLILGTVCEGPGDWIGNGNLWEDFSCDLLGIEDKDPSLKTIANNGGPTATREPKSTSQAIDNGIDARCPSKDQRGVTRGDCWIGAYEED